MSEGMSENFIEESKELEWLTRNDLSQVEKESVGQKMIRKVKSNPFVPIGCGVTVAALTYGLVNFYRGNQIMSQYMMRARVTAQAFTIVAMVIGFMLTANKNQKST